MNLARKTTGLFLTVSMLTPLLKQFELRFRGEQKYVQAPARSCRSRQYLHMHIKQCPEPVGTWQTKPHTQNNVWRKKELKANETKVQCQSVYRGESFSCSRSCACRSTTMYRNVGSKWKHIFLGKEVAVVARDVWNSA